LCLGKLDYSNKQERHRARSVRRRNGLMSLSRYVAVIDDDASLCRSLARLLQLSGFQVITFESAEQFLADPLRSHFGCLLVDVQLGGMSGIEMHGKLLEQDNRTPVVYITAFDDPRARKEAERLGCAGYYRKTDSGPVILETVRRITSAASQG
jgi:FixJ family two-component response regulator